MSTAQNDDFDILYDGYVKYMKEVKGYLTCPSRAEIYQWELFRRSVFDKKQPQPIEKI